MLFHMESLNSRKSILKAELADLDGVIDKGDGSDADGHRRREVVRLIQEVEKVDAMEVAHKAKIKWSIEGDENWKEVSNEEIKREVWDCGIDKAPGPDDFTFGFYRRPISLIGSLYKVIAKVLANRLVTVLDDIVDEIQSAFVTDRQILDGPFILTEIVHWSPRPDGFTFGLYRRYWDIIGNDVVDVVKWFFLHGEIPKEGNSSFITLIPKVPNANMVKDFRPISLIGSLYKIIAKVLANRLVTVLDDIVDEIQSAFVDFEKAYDSVRWNFIDDILRRFGFGEKWCKWIQSCLYSSRGSVLVNGSPTKEFQFHKGLK
nr:transposon TX1 uncharacterized [Tanacetum cinerariifolium]